ncbi:MAG: hypothetical protein LQ345_007240, partial [Seirophora villosa]
RNGTITNESDGTQVWCEPTQWYDILWFIFANFILHALSAAARANALCMVVRSPEWRPKDGQVVEGCAFDELEGPKKKKEKNSWWSRGNGYAEDGNDGTFLAHLWHIVICVFCPSRAWPWLSPTTELAKEDDAPETSPVEMKGTDDAIVPQPTIGSHVTMKITDLYAPPAPRGLIDKLVRIFVETYRFQSQPPTKNVVDQDNVKIHGVCQLAPGYTLSYIPDDIKIYSHIKNTRTLSISRLLGMNHAPDVKLASTHDVPRILFSLIQTVSGGYSLYKARGSQIERYGFAAYGLTVLPYMMVSIINLIGSLLTSEYEAVYTVHSPIMDEMKGRGGLCDGVVGTIQKPDHQTCVYSEGEEETLLEGQKMYFSNLGEKTRCRTIGGQAPESDLHVAQNNHIKRVEEAWLNQDWGRSRKEKEKKGKQKTATEGSSSDSKMRILCVPSHSSFTRLSRPWSQTCLNALTIGLLILVLAVPHLIIAILSGWRANQSRSMHRTFVLNWLICGQLQAYAVSFVEAATGKGRIVRGLVIIFLCYGSYCIMGLVAVFQQMAESGTLPMTIKQPGTQSGEIPYSTFKKEHAHPAERWTGEPLRSTGDYLKDYERLPLLFLESLVHARKGGGLSSLSSSLPRDTSAVNAVKESRSRGFGLPRPTHLLLNATRISRASRSTTGISTHTFAPPDTVAAMKPTFAIALAPLTLAAVAPAYNIPPPADYPNLTPTPANASGSGQTPTFSFKQLWDLNLKFLDNFIYPADIVQARAINSTLLSEDILGRIDITRTFKGRELNTEYLFGLFANLASDSSGAISLLGIPLSYEIVHFAANQNIVSSLTRFRFNFTALNLVVPLEISGWNTYNARGEISQYDAVFKNWQWAVDELLLAAGRQFHTNSTQATIRTLQKAIAKSICGTSQKYCKGENAQYKSESECLGFLTREVRFGAAYELGKNTLLCRMVHQNMVPYRPEVHCPHVGKEGGGYCVDDKGYEETVREYFFTNSPYVPYGYRGEGGALTTAGAGKNGTDGISTS